jgi:hypothetical protein
MTDNVNGTPNTDFDLEYSEVVDKVVQPIPDDELTEKYRGKAPAEIARMHINAERKISQLGNELGSLRSKVDEVLRKDNVQTVQKEPQRPVTVDEIFKDPDAAIKQAVGGSDVARKADEAISKVDNMERVLALREFESRHPTFKNDLNDQAFQDWVLGNPARQELFRRADAFDVHSADALWQMWDENKELREIAAKREQAQQKRQQTLNAGKTVSDASTDSPSRGPTYSRAKLMELQIKAHGGDAAARAKWNDRAFQDELLKAYAEERVK